MVFDVLGSQSLIRVNSANGWDNEINAETKHCRQLEYLNKPHIKSILISYNILN